MIGRELAFDPSLSFVEKAYVRIFGAPISGLRIRCRRLLPEVHKAIHEICGAKAVGEFVSIIDVGCGAGVFAYEMAGRFPQVKALGIDNSTELIEKNRAIAAKAGLDNCSFEVGDALNFDVKETFDLAVCIDNLEHIEDDSAVLRNIHKVLKNHGIAIFHVPGLYRRWFFFARKTNFDVKGHARPGYTREEICGKIVSAGFRVRSSYYTYGWLETVTNNISYLITGADRRNKALYAPAFPLLNALAYFGQWSKPAWGAGVTVVADRG